MLHQKHGSYTNLLILIHEEIKLLGSALGEKKPQPQKYTF